MCTLFIWKCQTLRHTLFWFHDNLKEMITRFVPSSADIPNLRVCLSFSQFFSCVRNASLIMLFYIVSSCPAVEFVLLKTLNRLRTFLSLLLVSYMKPNQYSTMLDWKLEAVSTRIYWFLPFSSLPSILTAQTLQLRLGFIHHGCCSCTLPHWAPLWEEDKAIHWPYLICASDYFLAFFFDTEVDVWIWKLMVFQRMTLLWEDTYTMEQKNSK